MCESKECINKCTAFIHASVSRSFNDDLLSDKQRGEMREKETTALVGGLPIHKTAAARVEIIVVL